jgi:hypothetical protein
VTPFLGYRLQLQSNEPKLASVAPTINSTIQPKALSLAFTNTGRRPARQGTVTLFAVNDMYTRQRKLGEEAIVAYEGLVNSITNVVLPQSTGYANLRFDGDVGNLFLAWVIYFDGKNELQQAFIYRVRTNELAAPLDELQQPDYEDVCD